MVPNCVKPTSNFEAARVPSDKVASRCMVRTAGLVFDFDGCHIAGQRSIFNSVRILGGGSTAEDFFLSFGPAGDGGTVVLFVLDVGFTFGQC